MIPGQANAKARASLFSMAQPTIDRSATPFAHPLSGFVRQLVGLATDGWRWIVGKRTQQLASRRMRVAETVSLGEKRFVSIVQVDGTQFLVGGAVNQVSLLAILNKDAEQIDGQRWQKLPSAEAGS